MMFRARPRRESKIETDAVNRAKKEGWESIKIGFDGWPDRLFFKAGLHVWVEMKRPGRPNDGLIERQVRKIARLRKQGCIVYVLDSYEDVLALLRAAESDL